MRFAGLTRVLAAVLVMGLLFVLASCDRNDDAMSPLALEGRLIAPCCWTQTLDVHESDLAARLRAEIRARLARGERGEAIEADLVERYGEGIRAVPKGSDPRGYIPIVTGIAIALAILGLGVLFRRWTANARGSATKDANAQRPRVRDAYDDRLDDELSLMDESA